MTKVIKGKREDCGLSSSHFDLLSLGALGALSDLVFCGFGSARFLFLAFPISALPVELPSISSIPFLVCPGVRCVVSVSSQCVEVFWAVEKRRKDETGTNVLLQCIRVDI